MKWLHAIACAVLLASIARADVTRFDPPDPRLEKKVTLDVDYVKLQEVTDSLTKQSDVTIKAGSGERDWKVREQKVSIHAKDIPLSQALDQIARLLSFYVSREGKDKEWTYTIWQDKKGRDLEAEMLNAQREEAAQRIAKSRQGTLDLAKDALGMSTEDAMKQRDKNPMLAYMGGTKTGRGYANFLTYFQSGFPTEYELMMRGKRVFVPLAGLPANVQQPVADMTSGGVADALKKQIQTQLKQGDELPALTPYQMVFQPANENSGEDVESLGFGGLAFLTGSGPDGKLYGTEYGGGIPMSISILADPDSALGKVLGEMMLGIESGMSLDEANKQTNERVNNSPEFIAEALGHESPTEKNPPTDPELTREVEIKDVLNGGNAKAFIRDGEKYQNKILAEIARAIGSPVFKESFDSEMVVLGLFVHPGKQPLYKVLIGIEKAGCTWSRDGGALRLRPTNWALLRSYQIPGSFVAHYKDILDQNGALTLDDMATIASSLTDAQIQHSLSSASELSPALDSIIYARSPVMETLRLYASLTEQQKAALDTESGLPFSQLTNAQWDRLSTVIDDNLGGLYIQDGSVRLAPLTEQEIKTGYRSRRFEITVQVSGEKEPRKVTEHIGIASKDKIAKAREERRKAQEAAKAAEQGNTKQPAPSK